ncbi:MAG TPA: helix-hairpin-helix domain-containing protein [Candidatus Acidoferrales bacterium]|nr:helix-hairpin-helix domain-containing protein [Candidatus Acidoferrales bacterium]
MGLNSRKAFGLPGAQMLFYFFVCALIFGSAAMAAKKQPPAHPINLNTATLEQLEELPGVGPVTAKSILDFRAKSGPFKRTEDLLAVPRISKKRFQKIARYITVTPPREPAKSK